MQKEEMGTAQSVLDEDDIGEGEGSYGETWEHEDSLAATWAHVEPEIAGRFAGGLDMRFEDAQPAMGRRAHVEYGYGVVKACLWGFVGCLFSVHNAPTFEQLQHGLKSQSKSAFDLAGAGPSWDDDCFEFRRRSSAPDIDDVASALGIEERAGLRPPSRPDCGLMVGAAVTGAPDSQ
eukprot:gene7102-8472_t